MGRKPQVFPLDKPDHRSLHDDVAFKHSDPGLVLYDPPALSFKFRILISGPGSFACTSRTLLSLQDPGITDTHHYTQLKSVTDTQTQASISSAFLELFWFSGNTKTKRFAFYNYFFNFLRFYLFYFMYKSVLPAFISVYRMCSWCPKSSEKGLKL